MYIVQKNHLRSNSDVFNTLRWLSHKCKNLYNSALYTIRTHYDTTGHYLSEKEYNCGIIRKANRVKRGLYRCINCGIERNADINGAINILKKVALEDEIKHIQWSSCDIISPQRVKLVNFTS